MSTLTTIASRVAPHERCLLEAVANLRGESLSSTVRFLSVASARALIESPQQDLNREPPVEETDHD